MDTFGHKSKKNPPFPQGRGAGGEGRLGVDYRINKARPPLDSLPP